MYFAQIYMSTSMITRYPTKLALASFLACGICVTVMCLGADLDSSDDDGLEHYNYVEGKVFKWVISNRSLKKMVWAQSEFNPPLSARRAISLADHKRKQLVHNSDDVKWKLRCAAIEFEQNSGLAYWRVSYDQRLQGVGLGGMTHSLDVYVHMDGTVVDPKVSDDNRQFPFGDDDKQRTVDKLR